MPKIYKILFLVVVTVTAKTISFAQVNTDTTVVPVNIINTEKAPDTVSILKSFSPSSKDTVPTSVNVGLENIFNAKTPKEYTIADITVTGTQSFDPNLIISISGLAKGDKVKIPGGDNFSKAITNLWKQSLISDAEVYFTNLVGDNLSVEIHITDRPTLASFKFKG
ncbi:MAG: outer membrane protein assembly factor, partial [Bacteroidota bacterium]|nr:outer membrane protein assembly factor [Bacteroidota bacterium]